MVSIFLEDGLEKLSFEYVPPYLPHREEYIDRITKSLQVIIDQQSLLNDRILLTGPNGTGKTATAKRVGEALERIATNQGVNLTYVHVNCRTTGGKFALVQAIVKIAAPTLPLRGYGSVELLHALWDYLNEHKQLLVLTLDEIDYYVKTIGEDVIYELTRLTDAVPNAPQRINFLFIARDHSFIPVLSSTTLSKFRPRERFDFKPYDENQLNDILRERVMEAFNENAVNDQILRFIARNTAKHGNGDARYALQLLLSAGLIADRDRSLTVLPDHVREAQENTDPKLSDEDIVALSKDQKTILLALARGLNSEKEAVYLFIEEVEERYHLICEEFNHKPVEKELFTRIIKNLEACGIIILSGQYQIGLDGVTAEVLENFLLEDLARTNRL